eukprot:6738970-Alexandrium_andersonii.AAC.1
MPTWCVPGPQTANPPIKTSSCHSRPCCNVCALFRFSKFFSGNKEASPCNANRCCNHGGRGRPTYADVCDSRYSPSR